QDPGGERLSAPDWQHSPDAEHDPRAGRERGRQTEDLWRERREAAGVEMSTATNHEPRITCRVRRATCHVLRATDVHLTLCEKFHIIRPPVGAASRRRCAPRALRARRAPARAANFE